MRELVMSEFVESLRRLYIDKIPADKIDELLKNGKLTVEEHLYILRKDGKHE